MRQFRCIFALICICGLILVGCSTESFPGALTSSSTEQELKRLNVYLPDIEDEFNADWKAFYEKYQNTIFVVTGEVADNNLGNSLDRIRVSQGGNKRFGTILLLVNKEDRTEEIMSLKRKENVVFEGVVIKPKTTIKHRLTLENCKLLDWSPYVDPKEIKFDLNKVLVDTKAELEQKYSLAKSIILTVDTNNQKSMNLYFKTEIVQGTNPQAVLNYAYEAADLLNENARKLDDSIAAGNINSFGGLYSLTGPMVVIAYPEGMEDRRSQYYIFQAIGDSKVFELKLEKAYR